MFYGRFPTGATSSSEIKSMKIHGNAGFFLVFKNYFSFATHLNPNYEHNNICIPGLSIDKDPEGLIEVEADN